MKYIQLSASYNFPKASFPCRSLFREKPQMETMILFVFLILFSLNSSAQKGKTLKKNSIYAEILGSSGYLYDVAYDRIILSAENTKFSVAAGFQYMPANSFIGTPYDLYSFSPQINYMRGGPKKYFEVGLSVPVDISNVIFHSEYNNLMKAVIFHLGYRRYQSEEGGFFYKLNINPAIRNDYIGDDLGYFYLILMPGFSAGYTF